MGNNAHIHICEHCSKKFRGRKAYREHLHGAVVKERTVPSPASATGYAVIQTLVKGCLEMRAGANTKFMERERIYDPVETPLTRAERRIWSRVRMGERTEVRDRVSSSKFSGRRLAKLLKAG